MSNSTWRRQLVSSHVLTGSDDATSTLSSSSSSVASQSQSQSQSAPVSFNSARFSHLVACTPIGDDGSLILAESNGTIRMCVMGKNDKNEGVETLLIQKSMQDKNTSSPAAVASAATDVTMSDDTSTTSTKPPASLQSQIDSVGLVPFVCDSPIVSITTPHEESRLYPQTETKKQLWTRVFTLTLQHSHSITRVEWMREIEGGWRSRTPALPQAIRIHPSQTWLNSSTTKIVSAVRPMYSTHVTKKWRVDVKEFENSLLVTQEGSGDVWLQSYENAKGELTSQVLIKEEQFVALLPPGTSSASTVASSSSLAASSITPLLHISSFNARLYILSHGHIFLASLSFPRTIEAAKKSGIAAVIAVDPMTLPLLVLDKFELFVGSSPHTPAPYFRMKSSDYILRSSKGALLVCDRIEGAVSEFDAMTGELRQNVEPVCANYKLALPIVDFAVAQDGTMYVIDSKRNRVVEWTDSSSKKSLYNANGERRHAEPIEIKKVQLPPPLDFPTTTATSA